MSDDEGTTHDGHHHLSSRGLGQKKHRFCIGRSGILRDFENWGELGIKSGIDVE